MVAPPCMNHLFLLFRIGKVNACLMIASCIYVSVYSRAGVSACLCIWRRPLVYFIACRSTQLSTGNVCFSVCVCTCVCVCVRAIACLYICERSQGYSHACRSTLLSTGNPLPEARDA